MKGIITTILLIGSFAVMFFITWPEYQELRDFIAKAEVKETDLERMIDYNQSLDQMIARLNDDYEKDIKKIEDGVPDDHYVPSLFSEIKKSAQESGVKVENLTDFSEVDYEEKAKISQTEIDLQVEGGYSNFKLFINKLKNSARIITFKEITISKSPRATGEEANLLEYNLKIGVFSYKNNNGK